MKNEKIELECCKLEDQIVDIFTKPLKMNVFKKLKMMVVNHDIYIKPKSYKFKLRRVGRLTWY